MRYLLVFVSIYLAFHAIGYSSGYDFKYCLKDAGRVACGCQYTDDQSPGFANLIDCYASVQELPSSWRFFFESHSKDPVFYGDIGGLQNMYYWVDLEVHDEGPANGIGDIEPITYNCPEGDKKLYPIYPQQYQKTYHYYTSTQLRPNLLEKNHPACLVATKNSKASCISASAYLTVIMSNFYMDTCGKVYKGFWQHSFFKVNESMADMWATGNTEFTTKKWESGAYETEPGPTYPVSLSDFFMLAEPSAADVLEAMEYRIQMQDSPGYRLQTEPFPGVWEKK